MRNAGTILLSTGVLLIGFALFTPLLFFLIGLLLDKTGDGSLLLQMEYALLSLIGLALLVVGSTFSVKFTTPLIVPSIVAILAIAGSYYAKEPKEIIDWIVIGCYYLSLLVAFGVGIANLHVQRS